jgi:hypothetical protein
VAVRVAVGQPLQGQLVRVQPLAAQERGALDLQALTAARV